MIPRGSTVWLTDRGAHGGEVLEAALGGKLKVLIGSGMLPILSGFDLAPSDFGDGGGQLFALAQTRTAAGNPDEEIKRIDLTKQSAATFCALPGGDKSIGDFGGDARFGPPDTSFANTLFTTSQHGTIDAAYPDGTCIAFANLSKFGAPAAITFSADGSAMLVTVGPRESSIAAKGMILRVDSDGAIESKPVATGLTQPGGLDLAPAGFGAYTAEIFVVDQGDAAQGAGSIGGKVYRTDSSGKLTLVASGFDHPVGLRFVGEHLWVTGGDSGREPNGYIVQIDAQ